MQATKAKRGISVMYTHTFADGRELVRVVYQDGAKRDGYYVSRELDSLTLKWDHVSDLDRSYVVTCTTSGRAIDCDCPAKLKPGTVCRHQPVTEAMIAQGELDNGPCQQDGYPDGWGWDAERADAEDAYHAAMLIGPKMDSYRVS